jgi:uncharacterized protein (DUF1810 family)
MSDRRPDLDRFVEAQRPIHAQALAELRAGRKRSHWMWFIFPQLRGLGRSETARFFGIVDAEEARAFLAHPVLGPRLRECSEAVLAHFASGALAIFGETDALKFRSSMTLFEAVAPSVPSFSEALRLFYAGARDPATLRLLEGRPI